jgi:hypothetical protein
MVLLPAVVGAQQVPTEQLATPSCMTMLRHAVLPAADGELLSWNLSNMVPQARERHSWKVYNEDGQDSDEGSDGEGPIFKGMAGRTVGDAKCASCNKAGLVE